MPLVSICLPTLNSIKFLEERIDSILSQTLSDWEIVVFDSYSNDGTYEYLQNLAENDSRFKIFQSKPDGIYTNINRCIENASGDFIYIATSDDTMPANCLEELASCLQENANCDIAHSKPRVIDEEGKEMPDWWSQRSIFARSCGELVEQKHIRYAPLDGLLHLLGESVYISLTQFLYRREIFNKIGYFGYDWGSIGDFNWHMRASLSCNTIHTPNTYGDWRVHASQATAKANLGQSSHSKKVDSMIEHALKSIEDTIGNSSDLQSLTSLANYMQKYRTYFRELTELESSTQRNLYKLKKLFCLSPIAFRHVFSRLVGHSPLPEKGSELIINYLIKQNRKTVSTI